MPRVKALRKELSGSANSVQAVVLAFGVLEHVAARTEAVGVTAIAAALGSTKSRIHRHLRTLVDQGYLAQAGDSEKYQIGERLVALGRAVCERFDLASVASDVMRDLRDALGHYTVVSQVESSGVRVLATLSGNSILEIGVKRGSILAFHCSAQGKIALACGDPVVRAQVLGSRLYAQSPKTITNPRLLQREIERIRRLGWAVAPGESALGINTLAAPIFDAGATLVGTVAIVDSIQHIAEHPSERQVQAVVEAARRISALLGGPAAGPRRDHSTPGNSATQRRRSESRKRAVSRASSSHD